jgi:hypothetical protein
MNGCTARFQCSLSDASRVSIGWVNEPTQRGSWNTRPSTLWLLSKTASTLVGSADRYSTL